MLAGVVTSVFAGNGASRAEAIDFNLKTQTLYQEAGSLWYLMDLSEFPTDSAIQLVVSNQSGDDVQITAAVYTSIDAASAQKSTSGKVALNQQLKVSITAGLNKIYPQIYLYLTSSAKVAVSASAVETPQGVGCKFPVPMAFNATAKKWESVEVEANNNTTLRVDGLLTLKALEPEEVNGVASVWGLKVTIKNLGEEEADVWASIAMTCGAPLQDISKKVPAGQEKSTTIKYTMLRQITADSVFVEVKSDQNIRITVEGDPQVATLVAGADKAVHAEFDTEYLTQKAANNVDSTNRNPSGYYHWFRVFVKEGESKAAKMSNDSVLKIVYTNLSNTAIEVSEKYKYSSNANDVMSEDVYKLPANGKASHSLSPVQIRQLKADSIYYFINANKDAQFKVEWQLTAAEPGSICRTAIGYVLPENSGEVLSFTHNTPNAVWYKIDYQSALDTINGAIKLTIKNNTAKAGTMAADIKFDCDGAATPQSKGIAAGQTMSKTIGHALLDAYSGNGNHEIYVALTTDLNVTVSAQLVYEKLSTDRACLEAKDVAVVAVNPTENDNKFDFVAAGRDTAWYYIDLADIQKEGNERDLKVVLTTVGSVKIDAALSFSCPAGSMQEKSLSFSNKYERVISYSQIKGLKNPYVRIIANKSVHAELTPVAPKLSVTDLCAAGSFVEVKTDGSVNNPTSDSTWFHMNVEELRETLKTSRVYVVLTSPSQKFAVATMDTCYSKFELSYQEQTASGNGVTKREITADRLDLAGAAKELYINVKAAEAYSFRIVIEEIPVGSDCAHAEVFEANKTYTQAAGEVKWFKVKVADLRSQGQNATLTLTNADGTKSSLNGVVYTQCGGTSLGSQKVTLSGKDVKVKTAGLSGYPDSVVLFVESTGNVTYRLDLVNETGESCAEALNFDWVNGHVIASDKSVWLNVMFKGNVDPNNGDSVVVHIDNLSVEDAKVFAGVAYSCGEGVVQSGSRTVKGNEGLQRDVTSLIGSRDSILIQVTPDQAVRVWAEIVKMEPLDEPITICNSAKSLTYNTWYDVAANAADQWFVVSIKDLQENTLGDGTFRIQSDNNAKFKAEVSYVCPVLYPMTSKTLEVTGGKEYNRVVTRSDINSMTNDSAYIRVTSNQDARFQLEIQDLAGYDCDRAIEYIWNTTFENPAWGTKWYKVPFTDIKKDPNTGLKLNFHNASATDSVKVQAVIVGSCDEIDIANPIKDTTLTVAPNYTKESYLNHQRVLSLAEGINTDTVFLSIFSEQVVTFTAVPYAEVEKLDENVYCPNDTIDAFGNKVAAVDALNRENKKLGHKIFEAEYPFVFANGTKTVMVDVDSTYIFDGYTFEVFEDLTLSAKPVIVKKFGQDAVLYTDLLDNFVEDAVAEWNEGSVLEPEEGEDPVYNAVLGDFSWAVKDNQTATLTIVGEDCDDFVKDFAADFYEDKIDTVQGTSCVESRDTVVVAVPGYDVEVLHITLHLPAGEGGLTQDMVKPFLTLPVVVNGVVGCNDYDDVTAAIEAFNATVPAGQTTIVSHEGWNEEGTQLRLLSSCNDVLVIENQPLEFADSVYLDESSLETVYLCEGEEMPAQAYVDDTLNIKPVTVCNLTYNVLDVKRTGKQYVYYTALPATFEPTTQVVVGKHVAAVPTVAGAEEALAEVTAFINTVSGEGYSPLKPETVAAATAYFSGLIADPSAITAQTYTATIENQCGQQCVISVTPKVYEVENVEEKVEVTGFDCEAKELADTVSTPAVVEVDGVSYDRITTTITKTTITALAPITTATPTFSAVYYAQQADGTWNSTEEARDTEIQAFVDAWNVEGHAQVAETPTPSATGLLSFTDSCGNVLEIQLDVQSHEAVKNEIFVENPVTYGCAASETEVADTVVVPVPFGTITYDSVVITTTKTVVLAKQVITAPKINEENLVVECGSPIIFDAEVEPALILASQDPTFAAVTAGSIIWTVIPTSGTAPADGIYEAGREVKIKYEVTDECGNLLADSVTVNVENAKVSETEETYSFDFVVAYSSLLVVNKAAIEKELGIVLDSADIVWKQIDENGVEKTLTAEEGAKGFYLTPQSQDAFPLTGNYFVEINVLDTVGSGMCETKYISKNITLTTSAAPAMFITPKAVAPGELITLYNLDGSNATIAVYDMMGNLVSTASVEGVGSYSFHAQNNSGYYVVKVANGERVQSLKYVVK